MHAPKMFTKFLCEPVGLMNRQAFCINFLHFVNLWCIYKLFREDLNSQIVTDQNFSRHDFCIFLLFPANFKDFVNFLYSQKLFRYLKFVYISNVLTKCFP